MFAKNQQLKKQRLRRTISFRWLLILFIIIAGGCQISLFINYHVTSNNDTDDHTSIHHGVSGTTINNHFQIPSSPPRGGVHKKTDAIVYLAQFGNHSSYGAQTDTNHRAITGLSKLNKSLELLYTNYVSQFPTDVIIFYDQHNAPDVNTMEELKQGRSNLQFRPLDKQWWSLPYKLQTWQHRMWARPQFSIGYRLMMRWFAVLIWKYLDIEGYTHCMRLDDDSYILSKIEYNLFDYMRINKKRYGFRQPVYEPGGNEFDAVVDKYLIDYPNSTSRELVDLYNQDRGVGFYNNFHIGEVAFFLSPPASTLLRIIDESNLIFTQRLGDLVIQSTVVRLFLEPNEVHWFRDFTYEHMTVCRKDKCGFKIPKG